MNGTAENTPVNHVTAQNGRVAAICQCCGKRSKYGPASGQGEPQVWELPDWSCTPYKKDFVHPDGSIGSVYTCPSCRKLLSQGESLKLRSYMLNN